MSKSSITAIIIAKDEEKMLAGCLKTLDWVDKILVIDNGSLDNTAKIAKKYKARVVRLERKEKPNFSEARNKGLKEASTDWIFYIDADERATKELKTEILEVVKNPEHNAYAISRKNIIFGREFKYTGQRPDYVKRLFKKSKLKNWKGNLHEEPVFEGELGHLESCFVHQKHESLSEMVEKTNRWSEIEAQLMFDAGHPPMNVGRFVSAMAREAWLRMIRQRAFLDGPEGVIYAIYQVFSRFTSYAKLWEMQINSK